MRTFSRILITILILLSFPVSVLSQDPLKAENGMVVSASKIASEVGIQILKKGGNAVDAAVAVGFALAVTYPQAGNLGGGGFMVIHLKDNLNTTIDFREKAPLSVNEKIFQDENGEYLPQLSQEGATSSGVPGSVAGLIYALDKYGTLSLSDVIEPAIILAENGFSIEYRFAKSLESEFETFLKYESSKKVFTNNGEKFREGNILIQKDLANTLKLIKENGAKGFYEGAVAKIIVDQIRKLGGYITLEDLRQYKPVERNPVTSSYRGFQIVSMGPPSSGGISLIQMLNILENHKFEKDEWGSSSYYHLLIEAMKYAFADRSKHIGDRDFYNVPIEWLISKEYAADIFAKIGYSATPSNRIEPGVEPQSKESTETTHYSIVDKFGNAVSTTTTINSIFGSKIVVDGAGFLLNNEMDDFSSKPGEPNQFGLIGSEANKIEPGKRMLSSMTPTIVLKDNSPVIVVGTPGGSTIPTVVLQVLLNIIDFNLDIQTAINLPRIHHQWLPDKLFYERFALPEDVKEALISRGHNVSNETTLGRVEGIIIDNSSNVFYGATDPRGYGGAAGY